MAKKSQAIHAQSLHRRTAPVLRPATPFLWDALSHHINSVMALFVVVGFAAAVGAASIAGSASLLAENYSVLPLPQHVATRQAAVLGVAITAQAQSPAALPKPSFLVPTTTPDLVKGLYSCVFNRPADPGGLAFWTDNFNTLHDTSGIFPMFFESAEFQSRNLSNDEFLLTAYHCMMYSQPDGNYGFLLKEMDAGRASQSAVLNFLQRQPRFVTVISPALASIQPTPQPEQ